jgi:hypothetical protein
MAYSETCFLGNALGVGYVAGVCTQCGGGFVAGLGVGLDRRWKAFHLRFLVLLRLALSTVLPLPLMGQRLKHRQHVQDLRRGG